MEEIIIDACTGFYKDEYAKCTASDDWELVHRERWNVDTLSCRTEYFINSESSECTIFFFVNDVIIGVDEFGQRKISIFGMSF